MQRFTSISSRRTFVFLLVACLLAAPAFFTTTETSAQTKKNTKATPTPKKKATPAKSSSSASKKNDKKSTTAAKSKNAKDSKSKTTSAKSNSRTSSKSASKKKEAEPKNSKSAKNSKTADKKTKAVTASKTTRKAPEKPKPAVVKSTPRPEPQPKTDTRTTADLAQVIVTSPAVPVRTHARADAPSLLSARLGTVFRVKEKTPAWYRVEFPSGGKTSVGWISANAVYDMNSTDRDEIYRQIAERNYRTDMDFYSSAELSDFLSRVSGDLNPTEKSADVELKRLLTLRSALRHIPVNGQDTAPYSTFLKQHESEIVYSEPSGEWLVSSNQFWKLREKYQRLPIADTIAWNGAQNPLPGECEGYVNCHLFYVRMTAAEYLNLYPNGQHSAEALKNVTSLLDPVVADLKEKAVYTGPTDVSDRAEFYTLIAELRTIVSRLPMPEKDKTLQQLKAIAEGYR